ncbi:MAG: Lrp/AsnC family transcriptional regulator [Chloroflexi bacterium]|nr:Lrp/AsnC family transcriptional regulator [Chloroflexota bacterium]
MIKAYILVVANPGATKQVFEALQQVKGVTKCSQVMGPYDIVVEIEVEDLADVPPILGSHIRTIEGVENTTSLVTFPD